ncbi:hypothetical protein L1765_13665 [Microaerobacter geothermalis]|uniref:hypothetical protein n=1 Tax=Microaerobacter geothermalis TaxID=674972 RepID=UPI001F2259E4|nr:hypothetical protein [Microaerobacter geothermalis]MCF6095009.1 hypothetical protein [Microaerobacter geothermalis]
MTQFEGCCYVYENEKKPFVVTDIDRWYFACKYLNSDMGFILDKEHFIRKLQKGKISEFKHAMAV